MYRKVVIAFGAVALATGAGACGSASPQQSVQPVQSVVSSPAPASPSASTDAPVTAHQPPRRTPALRVLTEPAAGVGQIYQLITGARSSIDLTMYELADPTAEADLAADAARGVDVRVLLDQHLERPANHRRLRLPDRPRRVRPVGADRHHRPPEDPHRR